EVADFLDVVERCLGIVNTGPLPPPVDRLELKSSVNLADSLVNLRKDLKALSVVLLDESGRVLARAGDWSDNEMENQLIPVLMSALNSGEKVANLLGRRPPDNLYSFQGQAFNLLAAHVGPSATLIVVCEAQTDGNDGLVLQKLRPVARNLGDVLTRLGVDETAQQVGMASEPVDEFEFPTAAEMQTEQQDLALEDVFPEFEPVDLQMVDSFWDTALEKSEETIRNSDALSYEQARRLGLAPGDEDSLEPDEER
ncbi:MAG TPA: hypothetical protein VLS48_00085, partial [Anaerolineales bacterium]|nr:hypothetical protein [Anaerolineales bacterium]